MTLTNFIFIEKNSISWQFYCIFRKMLSKKYIEFIVNDFFFLSYPYKIIKKTVLTKRELKETPCWGYIKYYWHIFLHGEIYLIITCCTFYILCCVVISRRSTMMYGIVSSSMPPTTFTLFIFCTKAGRILFMPCSLNNHKRISVTF